MEAGSRVDQEKAEGRRLAGSPQHILGVTKVHVVQAQREKVEKGALQREKGENQEKGQKYGKRKNIV